MAKTRKRVVFLITFIILIFFMVPFFVWIKKIFGFISWGGADGHNKPLHDRKK